MRELQTLLKKLQGRLKGDFVEGDHPRADDGKFGEGGGKPGKKPAKKPGKKPAASEPRQPLAGHPLADKSPAESVQQLISEANPRSASANPRGYNTPANPAPANHAQVAEHVIAAVTAYKSQNSFGRPTIRDLFEAIRQHQPDLTVAEFQSSLAKMQEDGKVWLRPYTQALTQLPPESLPFVMPLGREPKWYVDLTGKTMLPARLKEGFVEGDHPRATDGKFGSGGGSSSGKKPAAAAAESDSDEALPPELNLPEGLVKKPGMLARLTHMVRIAKSKLTAAVLAVDETVATSVIPNAYDHARNALLATAVPGVPVNDIAVGLSKVLAWAWSKARGKTIKSFQEWLKGDFREDEHPRADDGKFGEGSGSSGGAKKPASDEGGKDHVQHLMSLVENGLVGGGVRSSIDRKNFSVAFKRAIDSMPSGAIERVRKHVKGIVFADRSRTMVEAYRKITGNKDAFTDAEGDIGGVYSVGIRTLFLDGKEKKGIYEHELGHAIDGPNFELSNSPEWIRAWDAEIVDVNGNPLSAYAKTDPQEGFAEFARAVYIGKRDADGFTTAIDTEELRQRFPRAVAFFEQHGLLP